MKSRCCLSHKHGLLSTRQADSQQLHLSAAHNLHRVSDCRTCKHHWGPALRTSKQPDDTPFLQLIAPGFTLGYKQSPLHSLGFHQCTSAKTRPQAVAAPPSTHNASALS